jgi:hypothetical protein
MDIEKTIPEKVELSGIREFVINPGTLTIDVHLENGDSYSLDKTGFLNFWNNTMNGTQRATVGQFVLQLSALAANVDSSKVTGTFGE